MGTTNSGNTQTVRRKRTKRWRFRRAFWPMVFLTVVVGVLGFAGYTIAAKIVRPFKLCGVEAREAQRMSENLIAIRKENASIERKVKYLRTGKGISLAARRLGWVKPGEILLVLPPEIEAEPRKHSSD